MQIHERVVVGCYHEDIDGGGGVIEVRGQWALEQPVIFANKYREREIMRRKDALRMTSKTDL